MLQIGFFDRIKTIERAFSLRNERDQNGRVFMLVRWPIPTGSLFVFLLIAFFAPSLWAQRAIPRTTWDQQATSDPRPELPSQSPNSGEPDSGDQADSLASQRLANAKEDPGDVPADLKSLFDNAQQARSVLEYNSVIERCKNIAGDTTRIVSERSYAKKLLSWAANRRGELRSDMAGEMVSARQLAEAENLDRAATDDFRLAIQNDPLRWRAHHNLGVLMAIAGEFPNAIGAFSKTIELNPKFVEAFHNRGEIYFRKGNYEAAIEDYNKAIALNDKVADLFSGRGNARFALGQTEAALADYQSAMGLAPDSAKVATEFADTCQSLGRWKEAAEAYQKAMKADPKYVRALQNAAWMMATCPEDFYRDPDTAAKTAQKAIDESQGNPNAHMLHVLAMSQAAQGDFSKAINTINQAIQLTDEGALRSELSEHRALFQRKKTYRQPGASN
jgi:tetratricopeptide (TPR) repeat protein